MRTIREIMTQDVATVTLQDNIYEIAVLMKQHDVGFIPVVERDRVIGCVTDRDLVIRGYAEKHSGSTAVETVMTKDCVKVSPDISIDEASRIMAEKQIRRLIIEENDRLAGVVAIGDLAVRDRYENEAGEALSRISEQQREPAGVR